MARVGDDGGGTPALIRWGAVVGGAAIGLALLVLLAVLVLALAFGSEVGVVEANVVELIAAAAIIAMFLGGLLAGWLAGVPGFAPGLFNGITVWGLIVLVSVAVGAPGTVQAVSVPVDVAELSEAVPTGDVLWAVFWAYLVGLAAAGLAGGIGGAITRPAFVYAAPLAQPHPEVPAPR